MAIRRFLQANPPFFAILRFLNRGIDAFSLAIAAARAVNVGAVQILDDRSGPLKFWRIALEH